MNKVSASAHVTANSNNNSPEAKAIKREVNAPPSVVPPHAIASLVEIASFAPAGGCFVEVGVYRGGTAYHLAQVAREQGRRIFLFDTFEGIPYTNIEKGDQHKVGNFNDTNMAAVVAAIPDAITVKGVFPGSIIPLPPVAFVHIDADQYDSIIQSVLALNEFMMPGGIIVFDDYACLEGATRAVLELYGEDRIEITKAGKAMVRYP